ncbi:MAG: PQQ-binding-like beta-propeller repeat protein, partial [Vicinamibacteraceae bacterium]
MARARTDAPILQKPFRLWPGVVAVVLQWLAWLVVPLFNAGITAGYIAVLGGFVGGLAVVVWWLFFSRARWPDRVGALVLMVVALVATSLIIHESVRTGMMGMMFAIYAIPVLSLAFVASAVAGRHLAARSRRVVMAAAIVLASGAWTLVRTAGITGDGAPDWAWRWTKTPEERLLGRTSDESLASARDKRPALPAAVGPTTTPASWCGFRGPARDGVITGVRIETDWAVSPPAELWRRPIGPGWSSFAVQGDRLYTQEQRGKDEIVACYSAATGDVLWEHRDTARFWESNGGAGPRATPTLSNGRVYTFGATGIVNALDADDGGVVWSRNAAADTDVKVPYWGFAGSPLIVDDVVIVAVAGRLAAYDLATGARRWLGPPGGAGYSSPHLATIDGIPHILLLTDAGVVSVAPADGAVLWEHRWPGDGILQPALIADGDVLLATGSGLGASGIVGMRRIAIAHGADGWKAHERWTSRGLKPYFNDFVVHQGHAFGFDGSILACVDLADGQRKWKGGRYGHGQLVLLSDQNLLLVLSEEGELALVDATPDQFRELARAPAL